MSDFLRSIYEFIDKPLFRLIFVLLFLSLGVSIIVRLIKTLRSPDTINLYSYDNLCIIAFGLSSAIEGYKDHFSDEDLLCNEHYVKLCVLHREICKILGEDEEGRKLKCSK